MSDATVIIPCWNASDTVMRSVQSAISQQQSPYEIIVVDDASTDDTVDVLAQATGIRLEILTQNGGPAAARNKALECATGTWIVVLDSDDTMASDRVARLIEEAEKSGSDIVLGNFQTVDVDGARILQEPFLHALDPAEGKFLTLEDYAGRNQVSAGVQSIGYLKPIMSRAFLDKHGLRYNETLRNGEDCHLIFEALAAGAKVSICTVPDYFYTARSGSISYRVNPDHISNLVAADDQFCDANSDKMSQKSKALFKSRRSRLLKMRHSEQTLIALKEKKLLTAAWIAVSHPSAFTRTLRQLFEAFTKRVTTK